MRSWSRRAKSLIALPALVALILSTTSLALGQDRIWKAGHVYIGNSATEQTPSSTIECPLFLENGAFAGGFHTLDLSNLANGVVRSDISLHGRVIEPVFDASLAATVTSGQDGQSYLLVAGEGTVTGGTGPLRGVTRVIVRCKYKVSVDQNGQILLIACLNCMVVLVRD